MREISLHILDIAMNSVAADATRITIDVLADEEHDKLRLTIEDNGHGMSEEFVKNAASPFTTTRTTRKVGLGLSLLKAGCEAAGGRFELASQLGRGTRVMAEYQFSHIDRPPMGDLADVVHSLVVTNPDMDIALTCKCPPGEFEMDTIKIREILQGVPLDQSDVSEWLLEYLRDGLRDLFGGKQI